jgi:hypothetical protein
MYCVCVCVETAVCSCRHSKSSAWLWMLHDRFYVNLGTSLQTEQPGLLKLVTNLWYPTSVLLCSNSCMWTCESSTCSLFKSCALFLTRSSPVMANTLRDPFSYFHVMVYGFGGWDCLLMVVVEVFINEVVGWMVFLNKKDWNLQYMLQNF